MPIESFTVEVRRTTSPVFGPTVRIEEGKRVEGGGLTVL